MTAAFNDNAAKSRFEYHAENGHVAVADYRREDGKLFIDYVEAPPELQGTGAAGKLMRDIVTLAARENLKVVPICGYAAAWMRKNGIT